MSWAQSLFVKTDITLETAAVRLVLSFIAGGLIGLEREASRQTAGLRTHVLVCVAAALVMLVSAFGFADILDKDHVALDPSRIAAQVVSDIGFLGAVAVLRLGNSIKGITTAASIWAAAAVGLAIGAGLFVPAAMAVGLILVALVALEAIERRFFPAERIKTINLFFTNTTVDTKKVLRIATGYGIGEHLAGCWRWSPRHSRHPRRHRDKRAPKNRAPATARVSAKICRPSGSCRPHESSKRHCAASLGGRMD